MTEEKNAKMSADAMGVEWVQLRRVDFERINRRSEDALAQRREVIMATLIAATLTVTSRTFADDETIAAARRDANRIMEAAK